MTTRSFAAAAAAMIARGHRAEDVYALDSIDDGITIWANPNPRPATSTTTRAATAATTRGAVSAPVVAPKPLAPSPATSGAAVVHAAAMRAAMGHDAASLSTAGGSLAERVHALAVAMSDDDEHDDEHADEQGGR